MDSSGANKPLALLAVCATILMTVALRKLIACRYLKNFNLIVMSIVSGDNSVEQYDTGRDLNAIVINRTYTQRNDSFEASVQYFGVSLSLMRYRFIIIY